MRDEAGQIVDYGLEVPDEVHALVREQRVAMRRRMGATHARRPDSIGLQQLVLTALPIGAVALVVGLGLILGLLG